MSCTCFGASGERRNRTTSSSAHHNRHDIRGDSIERTKKFSYAELRAATNNFSQVNKIGRGGFGTVYKGTLKNGKQVAVKALSAQSKQGIREFLTEIETVSNVRHQNLVELIGCCVEENNRILVYEYLENRSLDRVLFGNRAGKLRWETRAAICVGTASGLAYLHEEIKPHIVHRDIKASNVLLDKDYTPKIGDFGLAKLFPDNITHISTQIAGTCGYLAPEYVLAGQLTMKADIYSFGVLILEVVSGRSSSSMNWGGQQKALLERAWHLYEEGKLLELVDSEIEEFPKEEALRYLKVSLLCTQESANRRPMMSQVIDMLSRDVLLNEKEIRPPGLFEPSDRTSGTLNTTSQQSFVAIPITEVSPR